VPGDEGDVLLMGPGPNRSGLVCRGEDVRHPDDPGPVVGQELFVVGRSGDLGNLIGVSDESVDDRSPEVMNLAKVPNEIGDIPPRTAPHG